MNKSEWGRERTRNEEVRKRQRGCANSFIAHGYYVVRFCFFQSVDKHCWLTPPPSSVRKSSNCHKNTLFFHTLVPTPSPSSIFSPYHSHSWFHSSNTVSDFMSWLIILRRSVTFAHHCSKHVSWAHTSYRRTTTSDTNAYATCRCPLLSSRQTHQSAWIMWTIRII